MVNVTLDGSSAWKFTSDSNVTCLSGAAIAGSRVGNITGNGHIVYYSTSACTGLNGQTYILDGGGYLKPASKDLSTATELTLGTLKLEDTDNPGTASQAAQLLTLWQRWASTSGRDTASQAELDAFGAQIESSMRDGQVKAMDGMG